MECSSLFSGASIEAMEVWLKSTLQALLQSHFNLWEYYVNLDTFLVQQQNLAAFFSWTKL